MTQEELLSVAAIVERLVKRFEEQGAEYERKMAEHRDSFGARTEADRLIIEGLRAAQRVVKERDGLLAQVQDQRAEIERLRNDGRKAYQDGDALRVERDSLREEVASLKHDVDTLSCPYVSGQRVRVKSEGGLITQQSEYGIGKIGIINAFAFVARIGSRGWVDLQDIEPCDPPEASHDTPAGKEAAESVIRDFRSGDSEVSITGLFDDTKITVRREPDQDHGSRIVISDANDMGEANIYLTESGARQMATALIGLCDVRKVPQ